MSYTPAYNSRINWENEPSTASPINETNLNKMDYALYQHDQALQGQDSRISTLEDADKVTSFKGRTGAVTPADNDYTIAQIKATGTAGQVPTLNSQGKLEMQNPEGGGHEIVNPSGTSMPPRSKMKFMGSVSVTDDSTNDQTVVNITGGGGGGSGHTILDPTGSSMNQRTNLQFTGSGVTVSDNSTDDKTVVNISSSGHTIKDGSGTAMTAQPNLQFVDAKVTNDAQGQVTKVQNFEDINWDDWQNVDDDDDTYYRVLDAPLADGTVKVDLMKKLWENPSPSSAFASQNISLNSADYDFLIAIYTMTGQSSYGSALFAKGKGTEINMSIYYQNVFHSVYRLITYSSETQLSIGNCTDNGSTNNSALIPVAIYGIKKKVTISIDAIAKNVRARVDYSTEEREIGTWVDGSTLYEKTIDCGALTNTSRKQVAHNISNFKYVLEISGIAYRTGDHVSVPIPRATGSGSSAHTLDIYVDTTYINITPTSNYSDFNQAYVTLRYTKTT